MFPKVFCQSIRSPARRVNSNHNFSRDNLTNKRIYNTLNSYLLLPIDDVFFIFKAFTTHSPLLTIILNMHCEYEHAHEIRTH